MKSIGGLLHRGRPGEQRVFAAAFVVGAVNEALRAIVRLEPGDAAASSFARGEVVIGVSHGAVAGMIQRAAEKIISQANEKISAAGGTNKTILKIVTRPQPPPLQ
jgi:hypothetical protein